MFAVLMVIGLVGLCMMAIPALGRHALPGAHGGAHALGAGDASGHAHDLGPHVGADAQHADGDLAPSLSKGIVVAGAPSKDAQTAAPTRWRWVPSPRMLFSVAALYGAFGYALEAAMHVAFGMAALYALVPTLLLERFAVRPLWNLLARYQAAPVAPLETLLFTEATAVTPFRNGRGVVSLVREGRLIQLSARLCAAQSSLPIRVGERLRVEDIDAARERVTVSALPDRR